MSVPTPYIGRASRPGDRALSNDAVNSDFDLVRKLYMSTGGKDLFQGFKCTTFTYQSASPPTCPETCTICTEQYVPEGARQNPLSFARVKNHDDKLAAETIRELVETTQANYHYIRRKIETNGNAIVKRWQKKSSAKREQVLRSAMPDLLAKRHADLELVFEGINYTIDSHNGRWTPEAFEKQEQRPEDPHLAPYLNAETLCENSMRLLALIRYRAHAHPSEWIPFDREMIQKDFLSAALKLIYNPHCILMHGPKFGSLEPWSRDAAHRWEMCGYPLGRQLLRVQFRVSMFLRAVVSELLVHASDEASKGRDLWDSLASRSFQSEDCFVAASAYYSPVFSPPPKFDLKRIMTGLKIRSDAALDDTLLTQADPLYLRRLLRQTENRTRHSQLSDNKKRWMLFMTSVQGIIERNSWNFMLGAAKRLASYSIKEYNGRMQLPKEYEDMLLAMEVAVRVHFQYKITQLTNIVGTSPAFNHHFRDGHQITCHEVAYRTDPLFWALVEIATQNPLSNRPAAWCFNFIDEHLSKASAKENARIDQEIYDYLSDIACADEILTAIKAHKSYSPLPQEFGKVMEIYKEVHGATLSNLMLGLLDSCAEDTTILDAVQDLTQFPLPKKASNQEKLAQNIALKAKSKEYWQMVRTKCLTHRMLKTLDPNEKFFFTEKFNEYASGQPHIFEAKQNAIRKAIQVEEGKAKLAIAKSMDTTVTTVTKNLTPPTTAAEHLTGREISKNVEAKAKVKTRPALSIMERMARGHRISGRFRLTSSKTTHSPQHNQRQGYHRKVL